MGILSWIVLGLIAGILAKWIIPGRDPGGFIVTTLIGIAGAFVGGYLGTVTGLGGSVSQFSLEGIVTAVIGALVLLVLYRAIRR
ncbi:GlsB/YeaQ/YmgE family stress response membrane protein [Parahaliea mediterranea]|uniref:GlsB/YeaQ/YmgE family stress response membrane protein n=1 Tax=Parahaliea mediterranea TaxID=651086 RepID=A0A939DFH0_9GAMM|nr:GlsB/YeaQ/YmgE family stress response membrane protein [Parahaliea mediterranea]MBN7797273.1 GlsB/YeaQ/YmgE family stress response membrane protein [Parahaliea mediterranea]